MMKVFNSGLFSWGGATPPGAADGRQKTLGRARAGGVALGSMRSLCAGGLVALVSFAFAVLCVLPAAASAAPSVTEFTGGVTPGFTANRSPVGLTTGRDGNIWFTESGNPGAVARVNADGSVTELTGGVTPGFTANRSPFGITTGPDGSIWFTEYAGGVARVNPDGSVTEFTAGVTPGFTANGAPDGITTGPDGNIWFTEFAACGEACGGGPPGAVARINPDGSVTEFTGGVTPGFSANKGPSGITTGRDGNIWFTETNFFSGPGVARLNVDGSVTEFRSGVTPGFTANQSPGGITTGPDNSIWFTERLIPGSSSAPWPGAVARLNADGSVTELAAGVTPGFTYGSGPSGITTGPDGNVWFTENASPGAVVRITFTTPAGPGGGVGPPGGGVGATQPVPPSLSQVAQSHRRWREGNGLAQIASVHKPPVGTTIRFTLNESATVRFAFTQNLPGRKVRGSCVARTSKNGGKPACPRTVTFGAFSFTAGAGTHKVRFQGLTSKHNKLKPGSYTLIITATNATGQQGTGRLTFTIVT
jgi:streptogramin lyase